MSTILATVHQWLYAREFRIPPPAWPADLRELLDRVARVPAPAEPDQSGPGEDQAPSEEHRRLLADLATGLFRLRRRMVDPQSGRPLEAQRAAYRHVEAAMLAMRHAGVEIVDHTGERWVDGRSIRAVAFQPTAGLQREMILETIKPTVVYRDWHLQMGEVVVGSPEDPDKHDAQTELPDGHDA